MDVLIVENDEFVTKIWKLKLSKSHQVRTADSVKSAFQEIERKIPELVILDLRLNGPTHSGLDVYTHLRSEVGSNVPIIFITGLADNIDLYQKAEVVSNVDSEKGIFTELLIKPVEINYLNKMVDNAA